MTIEKQFLNAGEETKLFFEMDEKLDNLRFVKLSDDKDCAENDSRTTTIRTLCEDELFISINSLAEYYDKKYEDAERFFRDKRRLSYEKRQNSSEETDYLYGYKEYGIYKELREQLKFDLELKKTDSTQERFDKLKLLKLICVTEKLGVYPNGALNEEEFSPNNKIPLIDIMCEPILKNVNNDYADDSLYRDEFEMVINKVRGQVKNAKEIENELDKIHDQWKKILVSTGYDLTFTPQSGVCKEESVRKTMEYVRSVPIDAYEMLDVQKCEKSSVIDKFFIMLVTSKIKAEIRDYCRLVFTKKEKSRKEENRMQENLENFFSDDKPSEKLTEEFVYNKFYNKEVTSFEFDAIIMDNKKSLDNSDKMNAWKLILLKENPKIEDVSSIYEKAIKFARNYMDYVARYWASHNPKKVIGKVFKMSIGEWCIVFRELLCIYLNAESFNTTNQKGESVERTLMAVVKSLNPNKTKNNQNQNKQSEKRHERENKQEAHSNMALLKRLNSRMLLIFSSPEAAEYQFEIEKHILRIEEKVLSYRTIEDIRRANRIMSFVAAIYSEGEEYIDMEYLYLTKKFGKYGYTMEFANDKVKHDFISTILRDREYIGTQQDNEFYQCGEELVDLLSREEWNDCGDPKIICQKICENKEILDIVEKQREIHKIESAEDKIIKCMKKHLIKRNPKKGTRQIKHNAPMKIYFLKRMAYEFGFTYIVNGKKKQITIMKCAFDNEIQKILDLLNIK